MSLRTKVECGGLCLTNSDCGAFSWDNTTCTTLNKELLYVENVTAQVEIYIEQPNEEGMNIYGLKTG